MDDLGAIGREEPEKVADVDPDAPVTELAPDGPVIAEGSPSVEIAPLTDLDPSCVALDPELAKRQASEADAVIIDPPAGDRSTARFRGAGSLPSVDGSGSSTSPAGPETQPAGEESRDPAVICQETFPSVTSSVPGARRFATNALADVPAGALDEVRLMVSELATNAIEHAMTSFDVIIHHTSREIRVEVTDYGAGTPTMQSVGPDAPRGRGLKIVDILSTEWGVQQPSDALKTVWFTLTLAPTPPV